MDYSYNGNFKCFIAGVVIGAVVVLLKTPWSGKETRERLGRKAQDIKDKTTTVWKRTKDALSQVGQEITNGQEQQQTNQG